ncbi:hypothetical protein AHAS_Ahas06G0148400 [Arachis hypogaea]
MFIATRTSWKRKEIDEETHTAIEDFQHYQATGETKEEAFEALFGKEQPDRHKEEVSSLKDKLGHMEAKQQKQEEEIHGLQNMVKLILQQLEPGMGPEELEALLQDAQQSPIDANNGHGSTHFPNLDVVCPYLFLVP